MQSYTIDRAPDQADDATDHAEPFVPTAEDREEHGRWLAMTEAAWHDLDEPTPGDVLDASAPWWEAAPWDPELDAVFYGPTEDPEDERAYQRPDPRRRPTRVSPRDERRAGC
jgi:hypothetical protein